jgi:ribonuclease HIII
VHLTQRHKAESDPVVAAASILARAAFLEGLEKLGEKVGMPLPKGASQQVIAAGKTLVSKMGKDILNEVAKLHFKTKEEVLK